MVSQEIREGALVTDWTKIPVEKVSDGIKRQMVVGENVMVCRFTFDPFVVTDVHSHPHEQMTLVVKGKVRFTIDGLTVIVAPLLGVLLLIMATRRDVMGRYANRWWQTALGLLGLAAILATCYRLLTTLIG